MFPLTENPQELIDKCIFKAFVSMLRGEEYIDCYWETPGKVLISLPSFNDYCLVVREEYTQYQYDFEVREFILGISNFFIEGFITGYHNKIEKRCVLEFKNSNRSYSDPFLNPLVKIAFLPARITQINVFLWREVIAYHFQT